MGIITTGPVNQNQYEHQQRMSTVVLGQDAAVTAKAYPLLLAYDRDVFIDEVVLRATDTGTEVSSSSSGIDAWVQCTLRRAASGTAGASGTALSSALRLSDTADHTNIAMTLTEASATVTDPRKVRKGETLFLDFEQVRGGPNEVAVYIRWRTAPG